MKERSSTPPNNAPLSIKARKVLACSTRGEHWICEGIENRRETRVEGQKKRRDGLVFPGFSVASRLELTCEVRQQPEWYGIGFTGRAGAS